jgi:phage-related protein
MSKYNLNSISDFIELIEGISYVDEAMIFGGVINQFIDVFKGGVRGIGGIVEKILSFLEGILKNIFGDIEGILKKMISKATGVVKLLLEKLEALFGKLASKVLDLVKDLLSFVLKILKLPIDYVLSHFLEPIINIVIRRIIVPDLLHNGLISIPINKQDDKLIFDIRLPAMPDYTSESVDLGFNAGFMT